MGEDDNGFKKYKTLDELYRHYGKRMMTFRDNKENWEGKPPRPLSGPFFIPVIKPKVKVLVVGHETFGGWGYPKQIKRRIALLKSDYKEVFQICLEKEFKENKEGIESKTHGSQFWKAFRHLNSKFRYKRNECIAWSNLNRFDNDKDRKDKSLKSNRCENEEYMVKCFPLLPYEIHILRPSIVIIFTQDNTDLLALAYEKIGKPLKNNAVGCLTPNMQWLRISLPGFKGKAYKMFHPEHIRWSGGKLKSAEKIIDAIVKNSKIK